jgi:Kdo2-lipid IVA lauroyltransferase/acyltransferase
MRQTLVDFAAYGVVRSLIAIIQVMPTDMGDSVCRFLARIAGQTLGIRRGLTAENIARVFPKADSARRAALCDAMWHSLLLMVFEIAWAQRRLHRCNWSKHFAFSGNRLMLDALLSPRPCVVVTGHYGNFELSGYVTGLMGFETLAIARKLDNPFLDRWVRSFRGARGQYMVDKEGCAPEVDRHLQQGGILSLLADQHAGDKGCWVNFMGSPASCHKALALFSLSSGAPMVVAVTRRLRQTPMQFEISIAGFADPFSKPADPAFASVTSLTQWYNRKLAEGVSHGVEQYWWLHNRWRTPPAKVAQRMQQEKSQAA